MFANSEFNTDSVLDHAGKVRVRVREKTYTYVRLSIQLGVKTVYFNCSFNNKTKNTKPNAREVK